MSIYERMIINPGGHATVLLDDSWRILAESWKTSKELNEPPSRFRVQNTMEKLFPETQRTPVPQLIESALTEIVPFCQTDEKGHPRLLTRGSTVRRLVLGTPPEYFLPKKIVPEILQNPELLGEETPLVTSVLTHIAEGPDMDAMYRLKDGFTDQDIITSLTKWCETQNEKLSPFGYIVILSEAHLNAWNGETDQRVYTQLTFWKHTEKGSKKALLRFDIGEEPQNEFLATDARLTGNLPAIDGGMTGDLRPDKNGHWYVVIDSDIKFILKNRLDRLFYGMAQKYQIFVGASRYLYHRGLWREKWLHKAGEDRWYAVEEDLISFIRRGFGSEKEGWILKTYDSYHWNVTAEHVAQLELREADIVANNLLGLFGNVWEWPIAADVIGLGQFTQLGDIFGDQNILVGWLQSGAHDELQYPHVQAVSVMEVRYRIAETAMRLNDIYRSRLREDMNPRHSGPIDLVTRLKRLGVVDSATVSECMRLINPVEYLRRQYAGAANQVAEARQLQQSEIV